MTIINLGDIVEAEYNSGVYVGKVIEDRRNFFLIEVLAVLKHPQQGDLHNPGKVEGVVFPERKALAYKEKTNARKRKIKLYEKEIPNYLDSLNKAVEKIKETLSQEESLYNKISLQKLRNLEEDFYKKLKS